MQRDNRNRNRQELEAWADRSEAEHQGLLRNTRATEAAAMVPLLAVGPHRPCPLLKHLIEESEADFRYGRVVTWEELKARLGL